MNQVEQREEEDPDQVDDVPIEPTEIDWSIVLGVEVPLHPPKDEPSDHDHADDHVNYVQAGHRVVDREESMGVDGEFLILEVRLVGVGDLSGRSLLRLDLLLGTNTGKTSRADGGLLDGMDVDVGEDDGKPTRTGDPEIDAYLDDDDDDFGGEHLSIDDLDGLI